jgi:hypothetical protein
VSLSTCFLREALGLLALVVPFVIAFVWHIIPKSEIVWWCVVCGGLWEGEGGEVSDTSSAFTTLKE